MVPVRLKHVLKHVLRRFARICRPVTFHWPAADTLSAVFTAAGILLIACGLISPARAVHEEWNRRWDGPTHQADSATQVAIDKDGNVYVAGTSDDVSSRAIGSHSELSDYRLVKYAPDGTELWNRRSNGPVQDDHVAGLALDADGNAYVTGYSVTGYTPGIGTQADYLTLKYAPDGRKLWECRYDGLDHGADTATAIAVDAIGNAYVTGYSTSFSTVTTYTTLKYDRTGRQVWVRRYAYQGDSYAFALAVDSGGNAYVTGQSNFRNALGATATDCATVKYSPTGIQLWVSLSADHSRDIGHAIAVDTSGNVYLAGISIQDSPLFSNYYYLTLKYDPNGQLLWRRLHQPQDSAIAVAAALVVDKIGNVLVTGNDGTIKYGTDGREQWVRDNLGASAAALAVDAEGCAYIAGFVRGNDLDFALLKYGPDGRLHWSRFFDGPTHGADSANAVAVDSDGSVLIVGTSLRQASRGHPAGYDMRTVKYSQQP